MSKPDHITIARAAADHLSTYIGRGASIDHAVSKLDPELNINNLEELLEYYFVLTGRCVTGDKVRRSSIDIKSDETAGITNTSDTPIGVMDFISLLPNRIQHIDPETQQQRERFTGETRGRVDWNETIKHRYSSGNTAGTEFVCRTRTGTVDTTKNRVLLTLLEDIRTIVDRFDQSMRSQSKQEMSWFDDWIDGSPLHETLYKSLNNVYLNELNTNKEKLTNRELSAVRQSREPIYREASILLTALKRIRRKDLRKSEIERLLQLDVFAPPDESEGKSTLFELYWIFELLSQFDDVQFRQVALEEGQLVAAWNTEESEYLMFHDWPGFHDWSDNRGHTDYLQIEWDLDRVGSEPPVPRSNNEFIRRQQAVLQHKHYLTKSVFDYGFGRKTPDIVLMELESNENKNLLKKIFIGEVKLSVKSSYLKKGLQQLLEYGAHAKLGPHLTWADERSSNYAASDPSILESPGLELGYFVGDAEEISGKAPSGIQIYGFGESPKKPWA